MKVIFSLSLSFEVICHLFEIIDVLLILAASLMAILTSLLLSYVQFSCGNFFKKNISSFFLKYVHINWINNYYVKMSKRFLRCFLHHKIFWWARTFFGHDIRKQAILGNEPLDAQHQNNTQSQSSNHHLAASENWY